MMKDGQLNIRKALPSDSRDIEKLHRKAFNSELISHSIFSSPHIANYIYFLISENLYNQDGEKHLFFVVDFTNVLIGYLHAVIINKTVHINYIVIAPEYQGKGIGKLIFNYLKTYISHLGIEKITLDVDHNNYVALSWYNKLGFTNQYTTYIYYELVNNFLERPGTFKLINWLDAAAWQYTYGFSRLKILFSNLQELNVGRIDTNYWRIDEPEYLKNPEFIYALKNIDVTRHKLIINSKNVLDFINAKPEEIIFRMEIDLKPSSIL